MNRTQSFAFRLAGVAFGAALVCSSFGVLRAQAPAAQAPSASAAQADSEEDDNPFTPKPAVPLPPGMTGSTTNDPRVGLKPGLYDAGETAMGMEHLAFVKKPNAFQLSSTNPDDPAVQKSLDLIGVGNRDKIPKPMQLVIAQLAFANSDFAFQGTHLFQGNFYGVNFYDISNPAKVSLITSLVCPGGQGDVSVYGNLLFMSVEMPNGRLDCGVQGFPPLPPPEPGHEKDHRIPTASADRFRGVRVFDISDIKNPKQVAAVQTCRGSHTHTLVVDPNDKDNVYIYVSGTSFVRQSEELAGCSGEEKPEKDPNTSLFRIDVIKVPLAAPQQAKVVSSPRVFIDARTGALNGLNNGGSHDKKAEKPADTNQCHDITVYSALGLAAGACSGNGILLDIKDPVHPKRVDAVNDPNYSYWHSASFSNDGTKVVFTDEWGGGLQPRCRPTDPNKWGADAIFNLKDDKLSFASYYKMSAAQTETENCVAHNGSLIPVPGRDIEVQAWYQGGISVMDFTDPAHAYEIAYFDRGPVDANALVLGGDWSAYWYNGYIYGSEIARGLDVFKLVPSKFLTQSEIDAAKLVQVSELNVQNQQKITWPSQLTVAKAYLDQLGRSQALSSDRIADLNKAITRTQKSHLGKKDLAKLRGMAASVETSASDAKTPEDTRRLHALAQILESPTA
ncbi:LVIVD repeat-containing protein [Tunturiibacter gelidiferens]|uniref:LVIVD repeat-containing protein n=1 Tax=Tunturiibacter gelidiferens TaxID=3069689 RepID=UPI003D9BE31E